MAAELEIPERMNAAAVFVDANIEAGRGAKAAILCAGDEAERTVTYDDLLEGVNRFGNVVKGLGLRMEERVAILVPDSPEFVFAFFGTMKTGAVAIPMNTLLKPKDYEYLLNDSRAQVLVVHSSLIEKIAPVKGELRYLKHILVTGDDGDDGD